VLSGTLTAKSSVTAIVVLPGQTSLASLVALGVHPFNFLASSKEATTIINCLSVVLLLILKSASLFFTETGAPIPVIVSVVVKNNSLYMFILELYI